MYTTAFAIFLAFAVIAKAQDANLPNAPNVRRAFIDGRYGQMHVRIARPAKPSTRPPVVCLHQSPLSGAVYARLLAEFGSDRVVIAPDYPGFGESDAPKQPPEIADYARAVFDVVDSLGVKTFDVVGYHTGSKVGVEMALQQPSRVRKIVVIGASIFTDDDLKSFKKEYANEQSLPDSAGQFLLAEWRRIAEWRKFGMTMDIARYYFAESQRGLGKAWYGHRAAFNYQMKDHLPKVTQPVLVLNTNDDLRPYTARASAYMGNGKLLDKPSWTHGFLDQHTTEVAQILRDFFDAR
jgi:pimeloyl-ACP methyl ester carboxylesterase